MKNACFRRWAYRPQNSATWNRTQICSAAADELGLPFVLKTRRFGYDGKGQAVIRHRQQVGNAWQELGAVPLIAERLVEFDYEVSAIGARSIGGQIVSYPLTENHHRTAFCGRRSRLRGTAALPAGADITRNCSITWTTSASWRSSCSSSATSCWPTNLRLASTIPGTGRSRALQPASSRITCGPCWICHWATRLPGSCGMENLIGELPADSHEIRDEGFHVHDYGKTAAPGRKLGHITVLETPPRTREQLAATDLIGQLSNTANVAGRGRLWPVDGPKTRFRVHWAISV